MRIIFISLFCLVSLNVSSKNANDTWPTITLPQQIRPIIEAGFYKHGDYYYDVVELTDKERKSAISDLTQELIHNEDYGAEPLVFTPAEARGSNECIYDLKVFNTPYVSLRVKRVNSEKDKTSFAPGAHVYKAVNEKWGDTKQKWKQHLRAGIRKTGLPDKVATKVIKSHDSVQRKKEQVNRFFQILSAIPEDVLNKYMEETHSKE
jgi:hypothetical protein